MSNLRSSLNKSTMKRLKPCQVRHCNDEDDRQVIGAALPLMFVDTRTLRVGILCMACTTLPERDALCKVSFRP